MTGLDRIYKNRVHALVLKLMVGLHWFPIYLDRLHRIIVDSIGTLIQICNNIHTFANNWI